MRVVAEEPWSWFLFEDEEKLFLDVLVEQGPVSFTVTSELSADQMSVYAREGQHCLERLSGAMRHAALRREWTPPPLPMGWSERALAAVREWQRTRDARDS